MRCSEALPCREVGSITVGHATLWSPPLQGGRIRSCKTRGGPEALPIMEVRPRATGHVVALEPTSGGRQGLVLQGTWRRVGARLAHYLDLKFVRRGTRSVEYR
jgi:hypothetical protein